MSKPTASFAKIGLIYTLSNLVIKGMAFLTTPLFTRLMSQGEYGSFSSISSWANIISIVTALSLYSAVSRAKYDYDGKMHEFMSTITILGSAFALAVWLVLELNIGFWENIFQMSRVHIRSIMVYALFAPSVQTLMTKHRMYNEYKQVIALTWITLLVTTVASLGLTYIMPDKLTGRVIGTYAVVTVVNIYFWLSIVQKGRKVSKEMWKYACAISLPLMVHDLSGVLLNSSDRIIINQLCGETDTALYSIAYTIAMIATVLMSSVNQAWIPWFFDKLNAKDTKSIKGIVPIYISAFTVGCILLMLVAPEMVLIFGGKDYLPAIYVIPPVCFAIELQFVYTLYVNTEYYLKKTKHISLATLGATAVNIVLNYLFIPKFGYVAAAYTTVVGYAFMVAFHYLVVSKTEYAKLFDVKILLINVAVSFGFMFLVLLLYRFGIVVRIILMAALLSTATVYVLKNKNALLAKLK